jgi:hypothetical protein
MTLLSWPVLKRLGLLSSLQKYHIPLPLLEVEWLPIVWSVKSHSSLSGKCFRPVLSSWKGKELMLSLV